MIEFKFYLVEEDLNRNQKFDDIKLIRILRARKFDIEAAVEWFKEYLEWRTTEHMDSILTVSRDFSHELGLRVC